MLYPLSYERKAVYILKQDGPACKPIPQSATELPIPLISLSIKFDLAMEKNPFTSPIDVHRARQPIRGSVVGQLALNGYLNRSRTPLATLTRPAFTLAMGLLRSPERLVRYQLEGIDLIVPLDHPVPMIRQSHPDHLHFYGRIASRLLQKYPDMTAMIIGAGVGCTVAAIRAYAQFPILAIEPNSDIFRLLKRNMLPVDDVIVEPTTESLPLPFPELRLVTLAKTVPGKEAPMPPLPPDESPVMMIQVDPSASETVLETLLNLPPLYPSGLVFDENSHFLTAVPLDNQIQLKSIHYYFGSIGQGYTIVAFSETDTDIFEAAHTNELSRTISQSSR